MGQLQPGDALQREGLTENRAGAGTVVAAGAWEGRLDHREALHELRGLLGHLLGAGLTPTEVRETVEDVLGGVQTTGEKGNRDPVGN